MYSDKSLKRFWDKVEKIPDGCWLWTGYKISDGYGYMRMGGNAERVHRISLKLHLGRDIEEGMLVCHKPLLCHNRLCVNPDHLREATNIENCNDKILDGTYQIGEAAPSCKLTEEQVIAIRNDARIYRIIAEEYGVSRSTISNIKYRRTWSHI